MTNRQDEIREILKKFTVMDQYGNIKVRAQYHLDSISEVLLQSENKRIKELETVLDAWHEVFGTTQLTHAQARLEQAEKGADKRIREVLDFQEKNNPYSEKFYTEPSDEDYKLINKLCKENGLSFTRFNFALGNLVRKALLKDIDKAIGEL